MRTSQFTFYHRKFTFKQKRKKDGIFSQVFNMVLTANFAKKKIFQTKNLKLIN
jgi:hypothetical protein